eukprot:1504912-Prymnesium_polylepis.1
MIWSSAQWLVCHARGCSVDEAHAGAPAAEYRRLISELLLECSAVGAPPLTDVDAALAALSAYSASLPGVVPSAALARRELAERNGWFVRSAVAAGRTQPAHARLLAQLGVADASMAAAARCAAPSLWRHESGF